jgi:hypothetical protein
LGTNTSSAQRDDVLTGVRVAVATLWTGTVSDVERDGHVRSFVHALDVVTDSCDVACWLVAENLARLWLDVQPLPVALPAVPVRPTDSTGLELHDCPVGRYLRRIYVGDFERFAMFLKHCCAHNTLCLMLT